MATKPTSRQPGAERILDAAIELWTTRRWQDVKLEDIAEAAGASMARLHEFYPSRISLISAMISRTDKCVLRGHDFGDSSEPYRERLLDVLMRRFDALAQHKAAVRSIFRGMQSNPATAACLMPAFFNSMAWSLELAGIQTAGLGGLLRIKGLGLIYLSGISVWLDDESPD
ncbi:MAG: TetR/AcrR family transcriptional regulator, partial [Pseudomonadota bacterium]|nr:TetR/AcrR family transcriptional regulator [Pseudomonadota bacterium]